MKRLRLFLLPFAGCSNDFTLDNARTAVERVAAIDGAGLEESLSIVAKHGRRAIPFVEMTLHDASVTGRLNLIAALRRIEDAEAIPLLEHRALRDSDERVRAEAHWTLEQWAGRKDSLGQSARKALTVIDEQTKAERKI